MNRRSNLRRAIRALLIRPLGLGTSDVEGYTVRQVGRALQAMCEVEEAFAGRRTRKEVRYFATQVSADAWVAAANPPVEPGRQLPEPDQARARWPADAEPFFPTDARGKPAWKFTSCPPSQLGLYRTNTHSEEY